jgi:hypothetical protein
MDPVDRENLMRGLMSWEAIARRHADAVEAANGPPGPAAGPQAAPVYRTDPDASLATDDRARPHAEKEALALAG